MKILKLKQEFYDQIKAGIKTLEVRKINKDYIMPGDVVLIVDLDVEKVLGSIKIKKKWLCNKEATIKMLQDHGQTDTINFVKDHYKDVGLLLIFEIGRITMSHGNGGA